MPFPAIRRTGRSRTLTFSGNIRLKTRTTKFAIELPIYSPPQFYPGYAGSLCGEGRDNLLSIYNAGSGNPADPICVFNVPIGGSQNSCSAQVLTPYFQIDFTLASVWKEGQGVDAQLAFLDQRTGFTVGMTVRKNNTSGIPTIIFSQTRTFYQGGNGDEGEYETNGSWNIQFEVEEAQFYRPWSVPFTGIVNPFVLGGDTMGSSRFTYFEEHLRQDTNNIKWDIQFDTFKEKGQQKYDDGSSPVNFYIPTHYNTTVTLGSTGQDCGDGVEAEATNIKSGNWDWQAPAWSFDNQGTLPPRTMPGGESHLVPGFGFRSVSGNSAMVRSTGPHIFVICPTDSTLSRVIGGASGANGSLTVTFGPPLKVRVNGIVKRFSENYPLTMNIVPSQDFLNLIPVAGGAFSREFTYQTLTGSPVGVNNPVPWNFLDMSNNRINEFWLKCNEPNLSANQEEATDFRVIGHAVAWDSVTFSRAPTLVADDFSTVAGWAGTTGVAIGTVAGGVRITSSQGGTATKTYGTALNAEGYRYARLRIRSHRPNRTVNLVMGGKTWSVRIKPADTWVDVEIDMCLPDVDQGTGSANRDQRYPCNSLASDTPTLESKFWGVNRIATLAIASLIADDQIDLDSMTFHEGTSSKLHILGSQTFPSGYVTNQISVNRHTLGIADGRTGLDLFSKFFGTGTWSNQSMTAYIARLNLIPGWSGADAGGDKQGVYNNANAEAPHLGMSGWLNDAGNWIDYTNLDMTGGVNQTVKACMSFDLFSGYPGMGDPFRQTGYDSWDTVDLYYSKVFQGLVHGIARTSDFKPAKGAVITVKQQVSGTVVATGTADAQGYFETTPTPGALPFADDVYSQSDLLGTVSIIPTRRKIRVDGKANDVAKGIHVMKATPFGIHHATSLEKSGIFMRRYDYQGLDDSQLIHEPPDGAIIKGAQSAWHPDGKILTVWAEDGTIKYSENYAHATEDYWSTPVDIGPGNWPAPAVSERTGFEYLASYNVSKWELWMKAYGDTDFTLVGDIVSTPTDDAWAGLEILPDAAGTMTFHYNDQGTQKRVISVNHGFAWEAA
jgi:hypothetical protein